MVEGWQSGLIVGLETLNQILTAGIAITAFSLLLYAMTFNLRDRVARSFAIILLCVVTIFTALALGSAAVEPKEVTFWLELQWAGILFLPPAYLHFSDAVLATTGRPSRGRRRWLVRVTYIATIGILIASFFFRFLGPVVWSDGPAPHLQRTLAMDLFTIYYIVAMVLAVYNLVRAYQRTMTGTGRRRMVYLIAGAAAPALGSYPYLAFFPGFASQHLILFWGLSAFDHFLVGALVVVMAYSVAFFGVSWPDRVVKSRLFKWLLRGPVTASMVLTLTTLIRRAGALWGISYSALVPIVMVATILLIEHLITIFYPSLERWFFFGRDRSDLSLVQTLEERLLTRNDLQQFLEMVVAAVCDRLQSPSAFVAAIEEGNLELVVQTGNNRQLSEDRSSGDLLHVALMADPEKELYTWGDYLLAPLRYQEENADSRLLGLLGVLHTKEDPPPDEEQLTALELLAERVALALRDRQMQKQIFQALQTLKPRVELIQRLRAAAQYDGSGVLMDESMLPNGDFTQWVKEALTHYWGGPKLTESPLIKLAIVQTAVKEHDGNSANALRAVLRQAIEQIKPEGERRFTGEWILYNILEMKFMEGKKVREIALRLAMSEADLYRKQRVAIEAVARAIVEMEEQARQETIEILQYSPTTSRSNYSS
ncbi:MAG TPA: histidine kinase N-terminal 7TM domain-containing protein [Anaerolineaceae bacterium]|nr:histidine kinase N-terminal 7TM domain-containing protein [Anaerolineaceae bacterium]